MAIHSTRAKITLSAISFVLALFGAELAVRLFNLGGEPLYQPRLFVDGKTVREWCEPASYLNSIYLYENVDGTLTGKKFACFQWKPNIPYAHQYPTNPRGYFDENNQVHFRTNNQGFRGPDITAADASRPPNGIQIVLLGDSFTWGEGVSYEDTFGAVLGENLAGASPSRPVRVINCSQPGLDLNGEWVLWMKHREMLDPNLVILGFTPNDLPFNEARNEQAEMITGKYLSMFQPPRGLSRFSLLYRLAERKLRGASIERDLIDITMQDLHSAENGSPSRWQRAEPHLSRIHRDVKADGAAFMIVILPYMTRLDGGYPYRTLHETVVNFCGQHGIPVLDLLPYFEGKSDEDFWVHPVDQHPNDRAHRIIGEAVAGFLLETGILENPAPASISAP